MNRTEVDGTPEEQARLGQYLALRGFGELSSAHGINWRKKSWGIGRNVEL